MFFVYVLKSLSNSRHYIGSTGDLERRLKEHNSNKTTSLKNKGPFMIIHQKSFQTYIEARKREQLIKSYKGGNAFKKLLESNKL